MSTYKPTNTSSLSFAYYDVERRTAKNKFHKQTNTLIDWAPIEKELIKIYRPQGALKGQKPYKTHFYCLKCNCCRFGTTSLMYKPKNWSMTV